MKKTFLLSGLLLSGLMATAQERPNIILFLVDDMGLMDTSLPFDADENGNPLYCVEKLNVHEESGSYDGTAFDVGTAGIYANLYKVITEGAELAVPLYQSAMTINVIEAAHAENPLPVKF